MNDILFKEIKAKEKIIKKRKSDKIEKFGKSIIQHGKLNDRVILLSLNPEDDNYEIKAEIENLAEENSYSKIICLIRTDDLPDFILSGYKVEAYVPKFFDGKTDCIMVSKFLTEQRAKTPRKQLGLFSDLLEITEVEDNYEKLQNFRMESLNESHADEIAKILQQTFASYPFPIETENILKGIQENRLFYFGIWDGDRIVGLSGAEINHKEKHAEVTDFAVLPEYRGKRFAFHLLKFTEENLKQKNIKTAYAIARLSELGMNKTLLNASYKYSGTLVNNTHIAGQIESMNIYYKHLN